jgi:hypothetical protein
MTDRNEDVPVVLMSYVRPRHAEPAALGGGATLGAATKATEGGAAMINVTTVAKITTTNTTRTTKLKRRRHPNGR